MSTPGLEGKLRGANLKVTPQRLAVMQALLSMSHPTAEQLIEEVRKKHQSISSSTIYHILDAFSDKGLITKVYTHGDVMRYDAILEKHHHLHDKQTDQIEDYFDDELYTIIEDYLKEKNLPGFRLTDIKIKLMGKFTKPDQNEY
jgi:Fur family peroxide stress response transcriptional regulator